MIFMNCKKKYKKNENKLRLALESAKEMGDGAPLKSIAPAIFYQFE